MSVYCSTPRALPTFLVTRNMFTDSSHLLTPPDSRFHCTILARSMLSTDLSPSTSILPTHGCSRRSSFCQEELLVPRINRALNLILRQTKTTVARHRAERTNELRETDAPLRQSSVRLNEITIEYS